MQGTPSDHAMIIDMLVCMCRAIRAVLTEDVLDQWTDRVALNAPVSATLRQRLLVPSGFRQGRGCSVQTCGRLSDKPKGSRRSMVA